MDTKDEDVIQVPLDFALNLKCIVCGGYLSVPPIVSGNNGKNVCGRCDFITYNKQERRNVIYEDVAKLMTFPCVFDKCTKRIPWGEVIKHEKVCPHHTIVCPKKDCHENVLVREIVNHFTWQHKFEKAHRIVAANVDLNQPDFDSPQLLIYKEKPYLCFSYKCDSFLGVGVYSLDPQENQNVRYFVALSSNKGILVRGKQKILPYNSRIHCADCFENKCAKKHHKYSLNYKNNSVEELHNSLMTKFEIEAVKKILESERVTFKIHITDDGMISTARDTKKRKADISGESECDACKALLSVPDVSRKLGIPLMAAIREQVKSCPCKSSVDDILEDFNIADLMEDIKEEEGDQGNVTMQTTENNAETNGVDADNSIDISKEI